MGRNVHASQYPKPKKNQWTQSKVENKYHTVFSNCLLMSANSLELRSDKIHFHNMDSSSEIINLSISVSWKLSTDNKFNPSDLPFRDYLLPIKNLLPNTLILNLNSFFKDYNQ